MSNKKILTREGFEKLKKELKELKEIKRPKVLERLKKARSLGDLTESSEYSAAKEDLNLVERRIEEIEAVLEKAEIAKPNQDDGIVQVGSRVKVIIDGREEEFLIVGELEGDPVNKKISYNAPLGKALLGRKKGEIVEVVTPFGKTKYKIVEINLD